MSNWKNDNEIIDYTKYHKKHNFKLFGYLIETNSAMCVLISNGRIKEVFIINKEENKYSRENIFYAREFLGEEKDLTDPEFIEILKNCKIIMQITKAHFFFTDTNKDRHFDQIAKLVFDKLNTSD